MPRKLVSEKTLEINLCAEVLALVRSASGARTAFFVGMKQAQEARYGLDELMRGLPRGRHLMLQFKSPARETRDAEPYRFGIGRQQNGLLMRLAVMANDAVLYILPHFNTLGAISRSSPRLADRTRALRVIDTSGLVWPPQSHRIESWDSGALAMYSQHHQTTSLGPQDAIEVAMRSGLTTPQIRDWLQSFVLPPRDDRNGKGGARSLGQQLRGMYLLVSSTRVS